MKAYRLLVFVFILTAIFIFTAAHSQEDLLVLDNSMFKNPKRPPVAFHHDPHNELAEIDECNECHHVYESGEKQEDESSEDQSCADCHPLKPADGQPDLMRAFHANCKGCHLKKHSGPITCGECHVRAG